MVSVKLSLICCILFGLAAQTARAGVFTLTQFVDQHQWSVGLEPEVTLGDNSGFGINAKFTYGLTPLSNLQVGIGPGSGTRQFRLGGAYTFDFLPDIDGQLGAGVALQGYIYKLQSGVTENDLSVIPYTHKSFKLQNGTAVDPFLALPLGMSFIDGTYKTTSQFVMGSFMKLTPYFAYSAELGLSLSNTYSYIAGGIVYTH